MYIICGVCVCTLSNVCLHSMQCTMSFDLSLSTHGYLLCWVVRSSAFLKTWKDATIQANGIYMYMYS